MARWPVPRTGLSRAPWVGVGPVERGETMTSPTPGPPLKGRGEGSRRLLLVGREVSDQLRQRPPQVLPVHDHVDHSVGEEIFGALEAFRELLPDRRFDNSLAGEADERARLGDLDVAEH